MGSRACSAAAAGLLRLVEVRGAGLVGGQVGASMGMPRWVLVAIPALSGVCGLVGWASTELHQGGNWSVPVPVDEGTGGAGWAAALGRAPGAMDLRRGPSAGAHGSLFAAPLKARAPSPSLKSKSSISNIQQLLVQISLIKIRCMFASNAFVKLQHPRTHATSCNIMQNHVITNDN